MPDHPIPSTAAHWLSEDAKISSHKNVIATVVSATGLNPRPRTAFRKCIRIKTPLEPRIGWTRASEEGRAPGRSVRDDKKHARQLALNPEPNIHHVYGSPFQITLPSVRAAGERGGLSVSDVKCY